MNPYSRNLAEKPGHNDIFFLHLGTEEEGS